MTITDDELDAIRERDAARKNQISSTMEFSFHPDFRRLTELLGEIIYAKGVNNGNIFADTLANSLLKTGKIQLV